MTRRPLANVAQSVHQRLLTRARKEGRPFNELLQHYAIERFLYRLGQSPHAEKLLLKGALLLRVWKIPMARPTMDIDMLGRTAGTPEVLTSILRDCMAAEVDDDGMRYDPERVTTEAITLDADYQGWRIRFRASLGNARVTLQVDVGIGDVVYPTPIWIDYPVLLDHPVPHLLAYTPENAIAEKYQAMVELDKANSRMKDFHDIWTLARNLEFDGQRLSEAIRKTFERRSTDLPRSEPTAFTPRFYEDKAKQTQWQAFLGKGLATNEDVPLANVVKVVQDFLMPPTEALVAGKAFKTRWPQGGPWVAKR
ncbi:MAG: nucleotidyl transferase AbiEii/AbiGii toxin family protein [Acidiferrobacteraceae bacterium]